MDTEKHNENYIKEAIKKTGLEQPSTSFLNNVMQKIEASDKVIAYKPLISRNGWLGIAALTLIFVISSFYLQNDISLLEQLNLKKLSSYINLDFSSNITLSKNMIYGLLLTSVIILLQVPILKSRHKNTM